LPAEISVTDIQSLMQCPYRFYLGRLIGLQPMESLQDEGLTSDTGSFVHAVLSAARFGMPDAASWSAWLTDEIERRLSQGLSFGSNKRALRIPIPAAVAAKLKADLICLVPALSDWLSQRSAVGIAQGTAQGIKQGMKQNEPLTEQSVSRAIQSLGISIKGRIDRWERTDEGAVLIDFKTTSSAELRRQIKAEDGNVQLALYSWMVAQDGPVRDARYVSIRREGIEELDLTVSTGAPLIEQSEQVARDVIGELTKISSGSLIELSGLAKDPSVCDRCALRGVCRRDEWIDHHEPE
jgi:ATP-dependent helicase/nuclease subunit B